MHHGNILKVFLQFFLGTVTPPSGEFGYIPGEIIDVKDFSEHCSLLAADSKYLYSHEYSLIPRQIGSLTIHHAQHQGNREKNRYHNILAYDRNRVILTTDPSGADYINANYLDGFEKKKAYIASQGPLENTCEDFWRMVWENLSSTIVMVRIILLYRNT